jgi:hypothetical protein
VGWVGLVRGEVGLAVSICLVSVGFDLVALVSVGLFPLQLVMFQLVHFGFSVLVVSVSVSFLK